MDAQLKKGVLKLCVLHCIAAERHYGYSLMQMLRGHFPEVDESTVYAILRRLHADGDAEVQPGTESAGPGRKYYVITPKGKALLLELTKEWGTLTQRVRALGIVP